MSADRIMDEVAARHGVTVAALRSRSITPALTAARIEVAQRLKTERQLGYGVIGRLLARSEWTARYYADAALRAAKRAAIIEHKRARAA